MIDRVNQALTRCLVACQSREDGQAMAEYGLILALIAIVAITALTSVGTGVTAKFQSVATSL